jgi:hypothetical protein
MALTKEVKIDQITVIEDGTILYREVTRILEDDVQLSQTYHRTSLTPGQDLTAAPPQVAAIANVAWTAEIIKAYKDSQNDNINT